MQGTDIRDYIPDGRFLSWLNNPHTSVNSNQESLDNIAQHGCWCAKLDKNNPFKEFLGGADPVDDLDEICKLWFQARNANDRLNGGFCLGEAWKQQVSYSFSARPRYSSNQDWSCVQMGGNPINTCPKSTCEIDVYFMKQIRDYIAPYGSVFPSEYVFSVVDNTTCTRFVPENLENLRRKSSSLGHPFNTITSHFQQEVTDVFVNASNFNEPKTYGKFSTYGYADNGLIISEDSNRQKIKIQLANEYSLKFKMKSDEGYGSWYHNYRDSPRTILYIGDNENFDHYDTVSHNDYQHYVISGSPSITIVPNTDHRIRFEHNAFVHNDSTAYDGSTNYPDNQVTNNINHDVTLDGLSDNDWHELEFRVQLHNLFPNYANPNFENSGYRLAIYYDGVFTGSYYNLGLKNANLDGNQYAYIYAASNDDPNDDSLKMRIGRIQIKDLTYTHLTQTDEIKWWG